METHTHTQFYMVFGILAMFRYFIQLILTHLMVYLKYVSLFIKMILGLIMCNQKLICYKRELCDSCFSMCEMEGTEKCVFVLI